MSETTPPARRSTHVQVDAEDAGTSLVSGSESVHPRATAAPRQGATRTEPGSRAAPGSRAEPGSRAARRAGSTTSSLPVFDGVASGVRSAAADSPEPPPTDPQPGHRHRPIIVALSVVIAVLLGGLGMVGIGIASNLSSGAAVADSPDEADEELPVAEQVSFPEDTPASVPGEGPCIAVNVLASFENAEMLENLAEGYNAEARSIDGRCVTVGSVKDKSGVAATRAAAAFADTPADKRPTVWVPDSSTWLAAAINEGSTVVPATGTTVARSGIVLAMPAPLAFATGWYNEAPTWQDVFAVADRPDFWSTVGHPEWGAFKLGKTSPLVATSGQAALLASFGASGSGVGKTAAAEFTDPAIVSAVRTHELATSHYMATPEHFLWHAREAEQAGSSADFLSAVIVDEKSVWDYNRGMISRDGVTRTQGDVPHDELVAIYPTDGVYAAESTAVVLDGDWVDEQERAAAADFIRFAGTAQGQKIVTDSGYRDLEGRLAPAVQDIGVLPRRVPTPITLPGAEIVAELHSSFPQVRKRAAVLFLVDTSGSMNTEIPNGQTKIEAAKAAITAALGHFTDGDSVGVAAFSSDGGADITPGTITPVADIAGNRDALLKGVKSLTADAYTPLYSAVSEFTRQRAKEYVPDHVNAVVVLSDGANETTVPTITEKQMLDDLHSVPHDAPVLVFTLAYGSSADVEVLKKISSATGAHFYDASDPTEVTAILGDLVTSF